MDIMSFSKNEHVNKTQSAMIVINCKNQAKIMSSCTKNVASIRLYSIYSWALVLCSANTYGVKTITRFHMRLMGK